MTNRFDTDTAVEPTEDGRFRARLDPGWFVVAPNGGYVAALLLRALAGAVGDPTRAARSLTIHYTAPPGEGEAEIETRVERVGRSLTAVSARLVQDERLCALALAAFSKPREGWSFDDTRMPEVPPPERCPQMERMIPIHERFEQRWAIGSPPRSGGPEALCGGWIRLAEPRILDAPLAAAYADAFPPAVFSRAEGEQARMGVPTVDLTVHFRAPLPLADARPDAFTLAVFRSRLVRDGFVEEDGELWSADGRLLAHSRQLAIVV